MARRTELGAATRELINTKEYGHLIALIANKFVYICLISQKRIIILSLILSN